jgi:hypothetical protein
MGESISPFYQDILTVSQVSGFLFMNDDTCSIIFFDAKCIGSVVEMSVGQYQIIQLFDSQLIQPFNQKAPKLLDTGIDQKVHCSICYEKNIAPPREDPEYQIATFSRPFFHVPVLTYHECF